PLKIRGVRVVYRSGPGGSRTPTASAAVLQTAGFLKAGTPRCCRGGWEVGEGQDAVAAFFYKNQRKERGRAREPRPGARHHPPAGDESVERATGSASGGGPGAQLGDHDPPSFG